MKQCLKRFLLLFLAACMIFNFIGEAAFISVEATSNETKAPLDLKKLLPKDVKIPDKASMLTLAEKYYKEAVKNADATEKIYMQYIIDWKVEFTGKNANPKKAKKLSYPNSYLINYTNMKNLYTAVSSAAVSIDFDNPVAVGNLAAAVITYGEDSFDRKSKDYDKNIMKFRQDATSLYTYSLFLVSSKKLDKSSAVTQILNLGHLYIDMGKVDDSKKLFDEALAIDKNYMPAREGLAAYYIAKGDKKKAQKVIEEGKPVYIAAKMKKAAEDSSDKNTPPISEGDSIEIIEKKLDKLNEAKPLNAAEFFESLDPDEVKKLTKFVDKVRAEIKYTAPSINMIAQYTTLENFSSPMGQATFEAFVEGMRLNVADMTKDYYENKLDTQKNLGLDINMNFDIEDVIKNPEKYENFEAEVNISGIDELESKMKEYSDQMEQGINQGDGKKVLDIASKFTPKLSVMTLSPRDYSNPTDLLTQIYNLTIFNKKLTALGMYCFEEQQKDAKIIADIQEKLAYKLKSLKEAMDYALGQIVCTHTTYTGDHCNTCMLKTHKIHSNFIPQMNNASEIAWKQATDYMSVRYLQYIKPRAEATYKSAMGNVMLVSDPEIRAQMENELRNAISLLIGSSLGNVVNAYGTGPYNPLYHCGCDMAAINAALEQERIEFQKAEAEKAAKKAIAKKEFEAGIIPEGSPLYAKLDNYFTTINTPFVEGRISPMKTNIKIKLEIPGVPVSANYDKIHDRNRNTTTRGGGISLSADKSIGDAVSVKGSVGLRGEVTTDGNANITNVDVIGTAEAGVTAGVLQATGTYEASVMRGCKYSGEVAVVTDKVLQIPEEASPLIQAPKKTLWEGEYKKKQK